MGYTHFFKSAYGQLILIVFLPISVLASVGAVLVFFETTRAVRSEQDILAQAALIRYEPSIRPLLSSFDGADYAKLQQKIDELGVNGMTGALVPQAPVRGTGFRYMRGRMYELLQSDQHVLRLGLLDGQGKPLMVVGYQKDADWGAFDVYADSVRRLATEAGVAYGMPIYTSIDGVQHKFWLMVAMDDEPLIIAYYRIVLSLVVTGLITLLLLLLILNSYSKRWVSPIYEMRLFLQAVSEHTLSRRFLLKTHGEFYLLQKELNRALARVDEHLTELKAHTKQTEEDLQSAFDEMEMQNISIRQARDLAISSSDAKSAFLANVSHELRTPLNAIDGFINLLAQDGKLDSKQTLYVQTIQKSSAHLLALISDVLDFSKMDAGKLTLDYQPFDLYATVYEVADMLSPLAYDKGLRLSVLYYNDAPKVIDGDRLRVKQILTNLVGNAIKFTESGSVDIRVGFGDDEYLTLWVADTGRGIDDKTKQTLFTSFGQGDVSITKRFGGTGLGLIISKQLVGLMAGNIGFFDNEVGATFWFALPSDAIADELPALPSLSVLSWIAHKPNALALKASVASSSVKLVAVASLLQLLQRLATGERFDWVIADGAAAQDVAALLGQIRTHHQGNLLIFGYDIALDGELLSHYDAKALHEPFSSRQLYDYFWHKSTTKPSISYAGKTVLAVDDHLPNLLVIKALLGDFAISVETVSSGLLAVELITQGQHFDLILMDISMPVMSGLQAAAAIRNIERAKKLPRTPIVALSAHGFYDEKALHKSGIDAYASKPLAKNELQLLLQRWLDKDHETLLPATPFTSTAMVTFSACAIDWQDALERAANNPDLALSLLQLLQSSISDEKNALKQAWADNNIDALCEIAHRLVGGCRYTGVPKLRTLTERFYGACQKYHTTDALTEHYMALLLALDEIEGFDLTVLAHQ